MENNENTEPMPYAKFKRSKTCAVINCKNNEYNLEMWKDNLCEIHNVKRSSNLCNCKLPYE